MYIYLYIYIYIHNYNVIQAKADWAAGARGEGGGGCGRPTGQDEDTARPLRPRRGLCLQTCIMTSRRGKLCVASATAIAIAMTLSQSPSHNGCQVSIPVARGNIISISIVDTATAVAA